jgi:hypothetical protein
MASAYDDLLQGIGGGKTPTAATSAFDDLYPPAQEQQPIGYTRGRWQGTKPPSISGMLETFAREFREQLARFDRGLQQGANALPFGDPQEKQRVRQKWRPIGKRTRWHPVLGRVPRMRSCRSGHCPQWSAARCGKGSSTARPASEAERQRAALRLVGLDRLPAT